MTLCDVIFNLYTTKFIRCEVSQVRVPGETPCVQCSSYRDHSDRDYIPSFQQWQLQQERFYAGNIHAFIILCTQGYSHILSFGEGVANTSDVGGEMTIYYGVDTS